MVFWFIIKNTMLPILFLVAVGVYLDRRFQLDVKTLSKLMLYLIIPSFIFTHVTTMKIYSSSYNIAAAIFLMMAICFCLALVVSRWRGYDKGLCQVCKNALMFNNTGNLGVALTLLVFTNPPYVVNGATPYLEEALAAQIATFVVQSISLNTAGLFITGRGKLGALDTLKVVLKMPIIYAFLAALIVRLTGFDAPSFFLYPVMELAAKSVLPLAMVSMGIQLSRTKIEWLDKEVWIVSFLKLFVLPLFGLLIIYGANFFSPGFFTPVGAVVFLIYCAIPTAVNVSLFAIEFDNNPAYATQVVMNTTALSGISLTIYIFLGHLLFM